jgi:integrase
MVQEGLRRGEVASAEVVDLCRRTETLAVKGKGGRGRLTRVVPVSTETMDVLLAYFAEVGMSAGPLIRSTTEPASGVTGTRIYQIVIAAMYAAGVKLGPGDGCSPHALRHTTAHDMLDTGADILEVQQMLGHRSVQTTQMTYGRGWVSQNLRAAAGGRSYLA